MSGTLAGEHHKMRETKMSANSDKAKGRIKQAAGALTDNDKLQREGTRDERAGKIKQAADDAVDVIRDKAGDVADALTPDKR